MTSAKIEVQELILDRMFYIYYPVHFQKDRKITIWVLIDLGNKVNIITLAYTKQLGLRTKKTDVGAQKIDGSLVRTFKIVIAGFQVINKLGRARFFQKIFLLANISIKVILWMSFLTFSNANI